jgi:tetratricopeptide (TPR) repeat protein
MTLPESRQTSPAVSLAPESVNPVQPPMERKSGISTADELDACLGQARLFVSQGNWARAADSLAHLLSQSAHTPELSVFAAEVLVQLDRHCDARRLALEAASLQIDDAHLVLRAARLLRRFEEPAALDRLVANMRWLITASAPVLAELALLLSSAGLFPPARICAERMLEIAPANADTHYVNGLLEMFAGRHDASLAALARALSIEPRMANAHWLVAMQGQQDTAEAHVASMMRALPGIVPGTEAQAYLLYALHHRLHAIGRYDDAWLALQRGMAVMQRVRPYRRDEQRDLFQALRNLDMPSFEPDPAAPGQPGLIFIVGMFRSGTSLIERVLAGHPDVADGGETYQFTAAMRDAVDHHCADVIDATIVARAARADFSAVRERMHDYARWRSQGRRWLTEKLPSNFLNLGFILHALPEAKVIHLRRDPVETCFSNLRTIFRGAAPYASDQTCMAEYYLQYLGLMTHWHAIAPGRILDVVYADFVRDPERQAQRIFEYCGLSYRPSALNVGRSGGEAATASAAQVRQGILTNRGEAWKPYARMLEPLRRQLEAAAEPGAQGRGSDER